MIEFRAIRTTDPYSFQNQVQGLLEEGFDFRDLSTVTTDTHVFHIAYMTRIKS